MAIPRFWTPDKLLILKQLYDSGLSMLDVATRLHKTLGSINHAMCRASIARRPASQTRDIQFLRSPLSFHPKEHLSPTEKQLKVAGLMLYWGEGGKRNIKGVDFANSDPEMISIFLKFLRVIYQVNEPRLRIYLYSYNSLPTQTLIEYWSDLTKIPKSQFTRPYIRSKSSLIHDKMQHGLIHVRYSDLRLLNLIMSEIRQFTNCWDGGVVKHTSL